MRRKPVAPADGTDGEDFGAHGDFDDRSTARSPQLWASHHHGVLAGAGAGLVSAAVMFAVRRGSRSRGR